MGVYQAEEGVRQGSEGREGHRGKEEGTEQGGKQAPPPWTLDDAIAGL